MNADELKDEIAHNKKLISEFRKRQRVLEQQAALFGMRVSPEIEIEMEEIRTKIETLMDEVGRHEVLLEKLGLQDGMKQAVCIRVIVVEDQRITRDGLCSLLALTPDIKVIGEASNGQEAITLVSQLQPDVVLMDLLMPMMGGIEATRRICQISSEARILVLTTYAESDVIAEALQAGAQGYILKDASTADLIAAIRSVYQGHVLLDQTVAARVLPRKRV